MCTEVTLETASLVTTRLLLIVVGNSAQFKALIEMLCEAGGEGVGNITEKQYTTDHETQHI